MQEDRGGEEKKERKREEDRRGDGGGRVTSMVGCLLIQTPLMELTN